MFYRKLMSLAALATLSACSPSENSPAKPNSASAAKASSPAVAASAPAAASQVDATVKLVPQNQAKWQLYQCDEGKAEVRYYQDNDNKEAAAQVKHNGATYTLSYSPELSEDDLSTFSNGHQSWTIAKFAGDFYRENDGFLVMHERPDPAASDLIVDNLVLQNCQPK